jgi:hypothetical protein
MFSSQGSISKLSSDVVPPTPSGCALNTTIDLIQPLTNITANVVTSGDNWNGYTTCHAISRLSCYLTPLPRLVTMEAG